MTETVTHINNRNNNPEGFAMERYFTTPDTNPYDTLTWEKRNITQKNWKTNEIVFEQNDVEFPTTWSENAATIVTTKYFRGAQNTPKREKSLKDVINRVVNVYTKAAVDNGYMNQLSADIFKDELTYMLIHQMFSFNSPVWFNVGTESPQQVSACFILAVEDTMDSILNWYREEGFIFKGGSGSGLNLSKIRSSKELLSSGGTASGPVSFMRGADASAGTIKSGGATRRAAKMVVLDIDHPDIEEFIETKAHEENKIRALRDAGFDMDLGGKDIISVQYQNANNSVRVTDEFMRAVEDGTEFGLRARANGEIIDTIDARTLWNKIATAAWECADPGMQYDDTINHWHTNPETGRITASNPCSEYMSLDNSSCNLASLNLMKFVDDNNTFNHEKFVKAVEYIITAMEISISFADFPTPAIRQTTIDYRQLGIGYANLGALLMATGLAYDSPEGRALAGSITSLLTAVSYRRSAELAGIVGPYNGYARNKTAHRRVMTQHLDAAEALNKEVSGHNLGFIGAHIVGENPDAQPIATAAVKEWKTGYTIGSKNGWRNAQASVLAPTGTIGFKMDVDTTGIEPDFSLVKFKKMVGGGSLQIVNQQVPRALKSLGYNPEQTTEIEAYIKEHGHVVGAPGLAAEHYNVFDCAAGQQRSIEPMGHVRMMAAAQPFLSGAISKTVNLPETATVEEIADVYMQSWKLGLKATAVYRDNCKVGQPLSDGKTKTIPAHPTVEETVEAEKQVETIIEYRTARKRLPKSRAARTTSFNLGGHDGYVTSGAYDDGQIGEIFLKLGKQGSTLAGVMDAFSIALSIALQHGVPLETFVAKFTNLRFEPSGMTDDPDVRMAQSILDYVFRRLALDYLPFEDRAAYGIYTTAERTAALDNGGIYEPQTIPAQDESTPKTVKTPVTTATTEVTNDLKVAREQHAKESAPVCTTCSVSDFMVRSGSCFACQNCGETSGCS